MYIPPLDSRVFDTLESTTDFFMRPWRTMLAKFAARRWIEATLRSSPDRCRLSESGLKAMWEGTNQYHYLTQTDFAALLAEAALLVGGIIRAKILES